MCSCSISTYPLTHRIVLCTLLTHVLIHTIIHPQTVNNHILIPFPPPSSLSGAIGTRSYPFLSSLQEGAGTGVDAQMGKSRNVLHQKVHNARTQHIKHISRTQHTYISHVHMYHLDFLQMHPPDFVSDRHDEKLNLLYSQPLPPLSCHYSMVSEAEGRKRRGLIAGSSVAGSMIKWQVHCPLPHPLNTLTNQINYLSHTI